MTAVATYSPKPQINDLSEIAKMILIAAITLLLMALATSTPSVAKVPLTQAQHLVIPSS